MLLALILTRQFTKRWPDAARSGDERSALPGLGPSRGTARYPRSDNRAARSHATSFEVTYEH